MADHGQQCRVDHQHRREDAVAETLKKGTRVTGSERSELATELKNRYDEGESIRSLAASTGRSYGFVHRLLTEAGVTLRGRGGATRRS
ncbi:transcriptional regulator [Streptomonospora sp. NEAU-YY374]|nr:helix-turn-helix domain-containing protein [Streptomonospora nanhaiensis]MBV2366117.1 transcriptional regulator [Streptomonospora nanhaiensis]MBX9391909.1 transcriptional regulator [Streptomonospora nanhaiensis]